MLTIEVFLGSDIASDSWVVSEFSKRTREAFFDQVADYIEEELEDAYPEADVTVTCKPGIERLTGEETDYVVSGMSDDNASFVAETVECICKEVAEDFFENTDELEAIAEDLLMQDEAS